MGFESFHPAVNLLFFAAVLLTTAVFRHPAYLAVSFVCACAYCLRRYRWRGVRYVLVCAALVPLTAGFYAAFHHFGVTVLWYNTIGNAVTLESLARALALGTALGAEVLWLACLFSVFTADKLTHLLGSVCPKAAMAFCALLRLAPRIGAQSKRLRIARAGIGFGTRQGGLFARLRSAVRIFSALVTWTLDALLAQSAAMRCRGGALRHRRAYAVYRFDGRDRAYTLAMCAGVCAVLTAAALGLTQMQFDPRIRIPRGGAAQIVFVCAYALLCAMPLLAELHTARRFRTARRHCAAGARP